MSLKGFPVALGGFGASVSGSSALFALELLDGAEALGALASGLVPPHAPNSTQVPSSAERPKATE
jgi:hypothetical protein